MGELGANTARGPGPMDDIGLGPLAPVSEAITVGGRDLAIRPAGLVELARMAQAMGPVMRALEAAPEGEAIGATLLPALMDPDNAQGLLTAAAVGAGQPLEWVGQLPGDEQFQLVVKVIEVNLDFFDRRLRPTLNRGLMELLGRLMAGRT